MTIKIRDAQVEDSATIFQFICDLATYERALEEVKCTPESLAESLFGSASVAHALMIEEQSQAIGYAIYFYNYSTWQAAAGIYLEDLYIDPAHRGKGAGKLAMQSLAAKALTKGCKRFEWSVLDWNTPAIQFYEYLGAKSQQEWVGYRLEEEGLKKLAHVDANDFISKAPTG